jgi:hypothetical protein
MLQCCSLQFTCYQMFCLVYFSPILPTIVLRRIWIKGSSKSPSTIQGGIPSYNEIKQICATLVLPLSGIETRTCGPWLLYKQTLFRLTQRPFTSFILILPVRALSIIRRSLKIFKTKVQYYLWISQILQKIYYVYNIYIYCTCTKYTYYLYTIVIIHTVESGYNDIGLCDTPYIA